MSTVPTDDRLAIQALVAEYSFRNDTRDFAAVPELFADDGVWDESVLGAAVCEGREAIEAAFGVLAGAGIDAVVHIDGSHRITAFGGDTASGTSHLHAEIQALGHTVRILGYYADDYVKTDGAWRFARRALVELAPTAGLPEQNEIAESIGATS